MAVCCGVSARTVNANLKLSIFAERKCHFSAVGIVVYTALFHNFTCRHEACQALIYQLVLGLTGENGKYNYSKAVHLYPPFSDITCSAKNYKIALALTYFCCCARVLACLSPAGNLGKVYPFCCGYHLLV